MEFAHLFEQGVPNNAPCLDGHFPGNPIVPGAVLLGMAETALAERGITIARVQRIKFLRPLAPDTSVEISVVGDDNSATIHWNSPKENLAQARVALQNRGG